MTVVGNFHKMICSSEQAPEFSRQR
jgi:hypothetical protein